jgi:hypothetical protein
MGAPLMIYGLAPIVNPSFETDADGVAPTGWDLSASINGISETDTAQFHSPGMSRASAKSLLQNITDGTAGNKASAIQRFSLDSLRDLLKLDEGRICIVAMMRPSDDNARLSANLEVRQYSGGTSTPGSGTPLTPVESKFTIYPGNDNWFLAYYDAVVHTDVEWFDVALEYDLVVYNATSDLWWDRVFMGGVADLNRGVGNLSVKADAGYKTNIGDGVSESIRLSSPSSMLTFSMRDIIQGTANARELQRFERWLAYGSLTDVAFWLNREGHTNTEYHFEALRHDPSLRIKVPPGISRRTYEWKFNAYREVVA